MELQENLNDTLAAMKRPPIQYSLASVSSDTARQFIFFKSKATLSTKEIIKAQENLKHMFTKNNCSESKHSSHHKISDTCK